ncbi:MAG TPA: hypothetical protein VEF53_17815 [Patescibacteria group bacterium]|nr:hypothetical protein [Patescibacteria group bacterium]
MRKIVLIAILGIMSIFFLKGYILSYAINQEIFNILKALWIVNKPAFMILLLLTFVIIVSAKQLFERYILRKSIGERGKMIYKNE